MLKVVRLRMLGPVLSELSDPILADLDAMSTKYLDTPTRERCLAACLHAIADGDLFEFMAHTGLSESTLVELDKIFRKHGWREGHETFPPPPIAEPNLERLLKQLNRDAYLSPDPIPKEGRKAKKNKLAEQIAALTPEQSRILLALVRGDMAIVGGLAFKVCPVGWTVHGLGTESEEHTVLKDFSSCSCPDNRFRGRECKHIKAMRKLA